MKSFIQEVEYILSHVVIENVIYAVIAIALEQVIEKALKRCIGKLNVVKCIAIALVIIALLFASYKL